MTDSDDLVSKEGAPTPEQLADFIAAANRAPMFKGPVIHLPDRDAMTEIPKLTADEALVIRAWEQDPDDALKATASLQDRGFLECNEHGDLTGSVSDEGRAALAAFDAAERAKIEEALLVELAGDLPGIDPNEDDTATGVEHERREKTMLARHRERIRSQIRGEAIEECIACANSVARVLQSADSDGIAAFFPGGDARRPAEAAALTVRDSIRANVKP